MNESLHAVEVATRRGLIVNQIGVNEDDMTYWAHLISEHTGEDLGWIEEGEGDILHFLYLN